MAFHGVVGAGLGYLTGTVQKTGGSAAVVGTGTAFLTELYPGYVVVIPGGGGDDNLTVSSIADNTHFTATGNASFSASGQTAIPDQAIANATFTACKYQAPVPNSQNGSAGIFDTDHYHFMASTTIAGTVTKAAGSPNIVGSGTSFTTALSVNQAIDIPGGGGTETCIIKAITDNTHLEVWAQTQPAFSASGQTLTPNPSCFAVPVGFAGYYQLGLNDDWRPGAGAQREGNVKKNGLSFIRGATYARTTSGEISYTGGPWTVILNEGDFLQNFVYQDSGGTLNLTPGYFFEMIWKGFV